MRIGRIVPGLAVFTLALVSSHAQLPQTGVSFTIDGMAQGKCAVIHGPVGTEGEPFTGVLRTTCAQKLGDGSTITHRSATEEARDSSGRTFRATLNESPAAAEGRAPKFSIAEVRDPARGVVISWDASSKEARMVHVADAEHAPASRPSQPAVKLPPIPPVEIAPGTFSESLGTRTINGVEAEGSRVTRVIPAGMEGNDAPITISTETWNSVELGATVLRIDTDPRSGVNTTELTEIELGGPDPSLFQVPDGYTIKEVYPGRQD